MAKAGRGSDQFPLRLPDGLRDRIKEAADRNNRSMNAEIVATLEETYPLGPEWLSELKFVDEIDKIRAQLDRLRRDAFRKEALAVEKVLSKPDKPRDKRGEDD